MANEFQFFPEQASTLAKEVDLLYFVLIAITVFFTVIITAMIVYLGIRYRKSRSPRSEQVHGNLTLEILWTVIPLLMVLVLFFWGADVFHKAYTMPKDGTHYYVTGKQWMWKIQHPTGHKEINRLTVPVGEKIILNMTSEDVIHDFFIPAFRVKKDVVPGMYTEMWFEATKVGSYHLFCAEYCGTEHSLMIGKVDVLSKADYEAWLDAQPDPEGMAQLGEAMFSRLQCGNCHGPEAAPTGPSLHKIFGTEVQLADGSTALRNDAYMRESILEPASKVVNGYPAKMPTYKDDLTEEQVRQLISYIKTLGTTEDVAGVGSMGGGENR